MLRAGVVALLAYFAYLGFLYWVQRGVLYPGTSIDPPLGVAERTSGLESVWLSTSAGAVEAWYLPVAREFAGAPAPVVLFTHGNGELIDYWPEAFHGLRARGVAVLLLEYPGYGRSEGVPSEGTIHEAAVAAYDWVGKRPDVDPNRIIAYGRSLGGGAACGLSRERPVAALVLQSTFTSVTAMTRRLLAPDFLVPDHFDNLSAVRDYAGPLLVAHGRSDDLVPYSQGVALAEAARRGRLISFDCAHNDCPPDFDAFWRDLVKFLREHGLMA